MADFTSMSGPTATPTADPNGVSFGVVDSAGNGGAVGLVLCTLAPNQWLTQAVGADNIVSSGRDPGANGTKWVPAFQVRDLRNEGTIL